MKLIVGLGNPGEKYFSTRHNLGADFLILAQKIAKKKGIPFSSWNFNKKFKAFISQGKIKEEKIILALPQTFMNNSGQSVQLLMEFYKIPLHNLTVIHDDIDIPLGEFKIQQNKSSAGHKGVQSIIDKIGSQNFQRVRIGINPQIKNGVSLLKIPTEKFVLQKFSSKEKNKIQNLTEKILPKLIF